MAPRQTRAGGMGARGHNPDRACPVWPALVDVDAGVHPAFAAMGGPGQLVLVVPELRLVVAIQSRPACTGQYGDAPHIE
jgi:hypothetical protein